MEYIVKYSGSLPLSDYPCQILNESYAIVEMEPEQLAPYLRNSEVEYVEPSQKTYLSTLYREYLESPVFSRGSQINLDGTGVVIGIIDSGIDINHPAFRTPEGQSRILSIWDLGLEGTPPVGFENGHLCSYTEIEAGTAPSQDTNGHGSAMAGVAAGNEGIAPGASLVVVKLGSESSNTTDIMRGIKYIIDQAQLLDMPCVINLSYGTNFGAHRGKSLFEYYITDMSQQWKNVIVSATGNEGGSGHHYHGQLQGGESIQADFSIASEFSSIYLILWNNFVDTFDYEIILPSGRSSGKLSLTEGLMELQVEGVDLQIYFREPTHYNEDSSVLFQLRSSNVLPVGNWSLVCYGEDITVGRLDIWLPTVEEVGRETRFLNPSEDMTATLPATARRVIAVGGYRLGTNTLSSFSGRGEVTPDGNSLPDLVAPAEGVRTVKSGGGYDTFSGTSIAAPFVSGTVALMMEWGIVQGNDPFLYGQRIRAYLRKNASRNDYLTYPNPLWGYGMLDIADTIRNLTLNA